MRRGDDAGGRYEFRAWGELCDARASLAGVGRWCGEEELRDWYLLGPLTSVSAKLRHGVLEVKRLVETTGDYERWRPAWAHEGPFPTAVVDDLVVEVGAPPPTVDGGELAEPELVEVFLEAEGTASVLVAKTRRRYRLGGARAEATRVVIDGGGSPLWTVAVEHTDIERLVDARASLGLSGAENVSVNVALARELMARGRR